MKAVLIAAILCSGIAFGQVSLTAQPPPPVTVAGGIAVGARGGATLYYWIVARYPSGSAQPSAPAIVPNTVGEFNLSGANYVTVTWSLMPGATGYDVLRSNSPVYPASPTCTACAVILNTSSSAVNDTGSALSAYPGAVSAAVQVNGYFSINNRDESTPFVNLQMVSLRINELTRVALISGTPSDNDCLKYLAGRVVSSGAPCGSGGDPNMVTAAGTLTTNAPMIGAGAKAAAVGSRSGNTTEFLTQSGAKTAGKQATYDVLGNLVASAYDVGSGGAGSNFNALSDCRMTRTSGSVLDIAACGAGLNQYNPTALGACSTSAAPASNGTLRQYAKRDGTLALGFSGTNTTTCTGWTVEQNISDFPNGSQRLGTVTWTSGSWNNDVTDERRFVRPVGVGVGTHLSESWSNGAQTLDVRDTVQLKAELQAGTTTSGTTTNTSTAFNLALTPTFAGYTDKQVLQVKFHTACGNNPTLNVDGFGVRKLYKSNGTSAPAQIATGECQATVYTLLYDSALDSGTGGFVMDIGGGGGAAFSSIGSGTNTTAAMVVGAGASLRSNSADATAPNKSGTSLPASCAVGDTYTKTDEPWAWQKYTCFATNVWIRDGVPDYRIVRYEEEFIGRLSDVNIGKYSWVRAGAGAATSAAGALAGAHGAGLYPLRNNGGANSVAYVYQPDADGTYGLNFTLGDNLFDFVFVWNVPSNTEVQYSFGMGNTVSQSDTNFIGFRFSSSTGCTSNNASNTTWVYQAGSTIGTTNMPTFGAGWVYGRIRSTTVGTVLFSFKNGDGGSWSSESSISSGVPTTRMMPFFLSTTCNGSIRDTPIDAVVGHMVLAR